MLDVYCRSFDWERAWYPIAPLRNLDASAPSRWELLGKSLVVWQSAPDAKQPTEEEDNALGWQVADDACPHRAAPLSLGTRNAQDGKLVCRYHGWAFDGAGACASLPMGGPPAPCGLSSTLRPTTVAHGMLFAWGSAGKGASAEAAAAPPPGDAMPSWAAGAFENGVVTIAESPASWWAFVSNGLDPCHAEFLHEGIGKFSPERASPMTAYNLESMDAAGLRMRHDSYSVTRQPATGVRTFRAPCSVTTEYADADGKGTMKAHIFFVPASPRVTRVVGTFAFGDGKVVPSPPTSGPFAGLGHLVIALFHLQNFKLVTQDLLMMQAEDRAGGPKSVTRLPSVADSGVRALRRWLHKFGGGDVPFAPGASAEVHEVFDRWTSHTRMCASCQKTMRGALLIHRVLRVTAPLAALGAAVAQAKARPSLASVLFATAAIAWLLAGVAQRLATAFVRGPGADAAYDRALLWPSK